MPAPLLGRAASLSDELKKSADVMRDLEGAMAEFRKASEGVRKVLSERHWEELQRYRKHHPEFTLDAALQVQKQFDDRLDQMGASVAQQASQIPELNRSWMDVLLDIENLRRKQS